MLLTHILQLFLIVNSYFAAISYYENFPLDVILTMQSGS